MAAVECTTPSREEVHGLISSAPSIRYLSESNEGNLRGLENHWHKIYVGFQAILGQLKVQQRAARIQIADFLDLQERKSEQSPPRPNLCPGQEIFITC